MWDIKMRYRSWMNGKVFPVIELPFLFPSRPYTIDLTVVLFVLTSKRRESGSLGPPPGEVDDISSLQRDLLYPHCSLL